MHFVLSSASHRAIHHTECVNQLTVIHCGGKVKSALMMIVNELGDS